MTPRREIVRLMEYTATRNSAVASVVTCWRWLTASSPCQRAAQWAVCICILPALLLAANAVRAQAPASGVGLDRLAATPTPTPTSFLPGRTPIIISTATPTPTSPTVIVIPDLELGGIAVGDTLLLGIPPENLLLPVTVHITLSGGMTVPELDISVSLLGSDGVEDASWAQTIPGAELGPTTTALELELPLADFTPLDVDAYTLFITADPFMRLSDIDKGNNISILAGMPLLQASGILRFGAIETTLDESTGFTVSPLVLNGSAQYSGQTVTFSSLTVTRSPVTLDLTVVSGKRTICRYRSSCSRRLDLPDRKWPSRQNRRRSGYLCLFAR